MKPKMRLMILCSILSISTNVNYAFSTTFLNVPLGFFDDFMKKCAVNDGINGWIWNLVLHSWFIGSSFGIFLNPIFNETFGRKKTLMIFSVINFLASFARIFAIYFYSLPLLLGSRMITATSCSMLYQTQILFLQECAPVSIRGVTSFLSGINFALIAFLTMFFSLDAILGKHVEILVVCASVGTLISFLVILPFHETPKFLFLTKQDKKAAIDSLHFYQGKNAEIDQFLFEIEHEKQVKPQKKPSVMTLLRKQRTRRAVILACLALQNTTAFWSILLSSTEFLKNVHIDDSIAQASSTVMAGLYFLGTIGGMFWIAKLKRRTLVIHVTAINVASLAFYTLFDLGARWVPGLKYGCLACFFIYGFSYGAGAGPVNRFVGVELVVQNNRSMLQAISMTVNQVFIIITTFTIQPLFNVIGSFVFLILFVIPSVASLVYLYFKLPETKNRVIDEILDDISNTKNNQDNNFAKF